MKKTIVKIAAQILNSSTQNFIDFLEKSKEIKNSTDFGNWLNDCIQNPKWNTLSEQKKKHLIKNVIGKYLKSV